LTNTNGEYVLDNLLQGGNYTVTPVNANFALTPLNRVFNNFTANQPDQNFTGTQTTFRLSGQVRSLTNGAGFALAGVTVNLSGAQTGSTTTDTNGNYAFDNLLAGNYTVTPTKANFGFTPAAAFVNLTGDEIRDFTGQLSGGLAGLTGRILFEGLQQMNPDGSAFINPYGFGGQLSSPHQSSFSSDGGKIAYVRDLPAGNQNRAGRLYTARFDNSGETPVPTGLATTISDNLPQWTPDGNKIIFVRTDGGHSSLCAINPDGSGLEILTTFVHTRIDGSQAPSISPDGLKIVFSIDPPTGGGVEIFVIDRNGTNLTQLTTNQFNTKPKFSPDGTKIAFIHHPDGLSYLPGKLFVMSTDGTSQMAITPDFSVEQYTWSPDGTRFALNPIYQGRRQSYGNDFVVAEPFIGNARVNFLGDFDGRIHKHNF
jgi:hypothetical protein